MLLKLIKSGSYKGPKEGCKISTTTVHPTCSNWALHLDEKVFFDIQVVDQADTEKIIIIDHEEFKLHNYDILVFGDYPRNRYVEVYRLDID